VGVRDVFWAVRWPEATPTSGLRVTRPQSTASAMEHVTSRAVLPGRWEHMPLEVTMSKIRIGYGWSKSAEFLSNRADNAQ
jgi:hypothetical protein